MDTQRKELLLEFKSIFLDDEKKYQAEISERAERIREICSEDYWETGAEIEESLAEQHILSILHRYVNNEELDSAEQFLHYILRDYELLDLLGEDIRENVKLMEDVLPILAQINARKIVLEDISKLINKDIEDFKSLAILKKDLIEIEKELSNKWNDTSSVSIIHKATKEEVEKAKNEACEQAIQNLNKQSQKDVASKEK